MARLNTRASTANTSSRDRTFSRAGTSLSPSPPRGVSVSSDKENQGSRRPISNGKHSMASTASVPATGANKRRRLGEHGRPVPTQRRHATHEDDEDKNYYDPEQDPEERRKVRQGLRNNARELHDRADEFLNNDSAELIGLIDKQNVLMNNVKQTSDATMDSRFLLNASEITLKKSRRLAFGDSAIGIDVDEFVSKCMTFMRHGRPLLGDEQDSAATQMRRNRRVRDNDEDDDDDDADGDPLDWHTLGERVCFANNKRPAVPSFLLGPLSVEKRARATQRRATQRSREQPVVASKPQELKASDLERNEASNLTNQCQRIRTRLQEVLDEGTQGVEHDASDDMEEDEARRLFGRNNLAMNWEVPLIKFALNPTSFGQTVENLFYISFLVKDGFVSVNIDEDSGFPTLRPIKAKSAIEAQASGPRHQAIFSLDYKTWDIFRRNMNAGGSIIPHRHEEERQVDARGWYG